MTVTVTVTINETVVHLSTRVKRMVALIVANRYAIDKLPGGQFSLDIGRGDDVKSHFNRIPGEKLDNLTTH